MQPLADGVQRLRLTVLLARRPGELLAELTNVNCAHHVSQASDSIDEARAGEGSTDLIDAMERINLEIRGINLEVLRTNLDEWA